MIDIFKDFPTFASLNEWDQLTVLGIHDKYPMDIERIAEIFIALDKNEYATRIRVERECMYGYRIYK